MKPFKQQLADGGIRYDIFVSLADPAAADIVAYTRYPPAGSRGVASARAPRWGRVDAYFDSTSSTTPSARS